MRLNRSFPFLAVAALLAVGACSTHPPREQMAVGRASVDRASGPSAAEAPVELASARQKIEEANIAMARKDYKTARQLAEQADADANLAEAKARMSRSDRALVEVRESIRQLRDQAVEPTLQPSAQQ